MEGAQLSAPSVHQPQHQSEVLPLVCVRDVQGLGATEFLRGARARGGLIPALRHQVCPIRRDMKPHDPSSRDHPRGRAPVLPPLCLSLGFFGEGAGCKGPLPAEGGAGMGAGIGPCPVRSHPGVRLLFEIQLLRLGGAAGRAVQSHVTADRGSGFPCLVGWKGTRAGSGRTQVAGKLSPRRQRARRHCACDPPGSQAPPRSPPAGGGARQLRSPLSPWPCTGFTLQPGPAR